MIGRVALYGLAPQVSKIASFFVLPIITKDLTATDYGIAGIVTAYTAAFAVFQNLGLNVVLSNSFYKSPIQYKWQWRQIHGFLSIWSFIFAVALAAILYFAIPSEAAQHKHIIILLNCIPVAFFATTQNITFRFYHLSQKAKTLAVRTIIIGIVTVLTNLYTISFLKLGYLGWFISIFVGNILNVILFSYPIYFKYKLTPIFNFKRRTINKALAVSIPTIPHYYASYLLNMSDRVIMDLKNVSVKEIGAYNLAYTFGNYYSALVDAISLAVSPTYLKLYKENSRESLLAVRNLTYTIQISLFFISFIICVWIRELFQLLIKNPDLHTAYPIAIIIIMSYNYRPMYLAAINRLFFLEKTKVLWRVTFIAGALNVILNLIFIPLFGAKAAAVITFVSYLYMGFSGFFLKDYKATNNIQLRPIFWLLAMVLLLFAVSILVTLSWPIKVFVSFLAAIITFFFYKKNLHQFSKDF
ncbi:lipopolysaccharide biosynthesis protein [Pseudocnuella soli]|uniref:lipopolysaccharide biosynthesis protein n=1 Tax=Pseudocnuella soli TaxID=2502779 RepID=UPI001F00195D|nr:oligosaccharide flippase family protein [Pseudocnuella soli]